MPIKYEKLFTLMKNKKITRYQLKKEKIAGGATLDKLFGKQPGYVDTRVIERLCEYLQCQPGDIMEYVDNEKEE